MRLEQEQYIQEQYTKLNRFIDDVLQARFPVNKWIRQAVERYQRDISSEKYEFRRDKMDRFFYFLSYTKINIENKYRIFYPEPWQLFYFANLYGLYYRDSDRRKYTTSFLTIARKNGKTTLAAVQALYHQIYDNAMDAQVYFVSGSREMAALGLDYCKSITANSPALAKRVEVLHYSLRYRTKKTSNNLKALPAVADRLNGLRPHFAVIDEIHIMPSSELVNIIKTGQVGITNPLTTIITTRGFNTTYFQYQYEQYLKKVLDQDVEDEGTFIMIFALDSADEIECPEMWPKANPNLLNEKAMHIDSLKELYNQSRSSISDLRSFIVLNLNHWWETSEEMFLPREQLDLVFVDEIPDEIVLGEECYMGIDLSSTKDITAISLIFPPSINHPEYIIKNWNIKTNSVEKRVRKTGVDLTQFIATGELIELTTPIIDYDFLFNLIDDLSGKYNILKIGYDKFNSALLIPRVQNDLGIDCQDVPQTASKLNQAVKFLEKLVYDESLQIDNQCTKWQFLNIKLYIDGNGNYKIMKNKSLDSVDSPVAIVTGLSVYIEEIGEEQLMYVATSA